MNWGAGGTDALVLPASPDGPILPAGRHTDLPWLGIDRFVLTLSTAAPLSAGDVTVTGVIGIDYGPVTISGSGTTYTVTLAQPISEADRVTVAIGNASVAPFSGVLDVLPGDVNDDGVVNAADLTLVRNQFVGMAPLTIFGDIDGDGTTDMHDYNSVRLRIGTTLPHPASGS